MKQYLYSIALVGLVGISTSYGMQQQTATESDTSTMFYERGEQLQLDYNDQVALHNLVTTVRQPVETTDEISSCGQVVKELFFANKTRVFLTTTLSVALVCLTVLAVQQGQ